MPDRKVDFTIAPYTQPQEIEIVPNCISFLVVNVSAVGDPVIEVNGFPINSPLAAGSNGESFGLGGIEDAVMNKMQFNLTWPNGINATSRAIVVQFFYTYPSK